MTDPKDPPSPQPPAPTVPAGARVTSRHAPEWGKGVVMGREGKLVRVLFMAHPGRKPIVVSPASLVVEEVKNWPDTSRDMGPLPAPKREKKPARAKAAAEPEEPEPVDDDDDEADDGDEDRE